MFGSIAILAFMLVFALSSLALANVSASTLMLWAALLLVWLLAAVVISRAEDSTALDVLLFPSSTTYHVALLYAEDAGWTPFVLIAVRFATFALPLMLLSHARQVCACQHTGSLAAGIY